LIQANDSPIFVAGTGSVFNFFKRRQNPTASMQLYTTNIKKKKKKKKEKKKENHTHIFHGAISVAKRQQVVEQS
jgi:hypothetical protein